MKTYIVFISLCVCALAVDYDGEVDQLVEGIKKKLIENNRTSVYVPDYTHMFEEHIFYFPIRGSIKMSGIKLGDFSTLRRYFSVEPSKFNKTSGEFSILARFTMDLLNIDVHNFEYSFAFFHTNQPASIRAYSNSFAFDLSMNLNETTQECSTSLLFVMMDRLGDFSVSLGDSGFFSPSVEKVEEIALDWMARSVMDAVDYYIKPLANEYINENSQFICKYFLNQ